MARTNEQYILASQSMRKDSGFTTEKLDKCLAGLRIIIEALEAVQSGENTISGAFRDRGLNLLKTRTVMYDVGKIYEAERDGYGYGDKLEILSPLETFYCDIFNCDPGTTEVTDFMPHDAAETVAYIFEHHDDYGLTEREVKLTYQRYFDEMGYDAIAKESGVTRERVRQIIFKTTRKLRHPSRSRILRYGLEFQRQLDWEYEQRRAQMLEELLEKKLEADTEIQALQVETEGRTITLEELELSVRTYNLLKRAGYNTLEDVAKASEAQLMQCRNLGRKSLHEITNIIRNYYPEWK